MLMPTLFMAAVAGVLLVIAMFQGKHIGGLKVAFHMTWEIMPMLLLAFIIAGIVQVLIPEVMIQKWIGENSGVKGIFIGSIAGALTPGGPYVSMPIAAGLIRSGASIGTMVAFLTGWSLWAISRLPIEVGVLGWRLAIIRMISILFVPPMAGFIAQAVSKFI